jgi:hypothetical protein
VAVLFAAAVCLALSAQAVAALSVHRVRVASMSGVRGVLAYDQTTRVIGHFTLNGKTVSETQTNYANLRAAVFDGGRLVVSQLLDRRLQPMWTLPIQVKDVTGSGKPTVIVDLYTGGAHCCELTKLYLLRGARLVAQLQRNWGDPGYRLVDIDGDGSWEFETQDDAFAYAFTDYADSARPIQIWNLEGAKFVNTTTDHPGAITTDARSLLRAYNEAQTQRRDVRGILPAYVADEALLGTPAVGWNLVDSALAVGALDRADIPGPTGNSYVAAVHSFLSKYGYT